MGFLEFWPTSPLSLWVLYISESYRPEKGRGVFQRCVSAARTYYSETVAGFGVVSTSSLAHLLTVSNLRGALSLYIQ